jgi:hypothetical protein
VDPAGLSQNYTHFLPRKINFLARNLFFFGGKIIFFERKSRFLPGNHDFQEHLIESSQQIKASTPKNPKHLSANNCRLKPVLLAVIRECGVQYTRLKV